MVKDRRLADDIFQETFMKVIYTLKAGRYNEEGKFLPWVLRIAHNIVIDQYRRHKKMPLIRGRNSDDEEFDIFAVLKHADVSPEDSLIRQQTENKLRQLIRYLPKEQKEVLIMRIYGELSFNEIAEQTQVSINTALGRMRYALINLRKLIKKKGLALDL
jgi:RNA polymerase sigma-70 factor (ECF subfamily)